MSSIPTESELVDFRGLDEEHVLKHFLGKSAEEAYEMFRSRGGDFTEDLMWMSLRGLEYYLPPAIRYVESRDADGDEHTITGLSCSLCFRAENDRLPAELRAQLQKFVTIVREGFERFGLVDGETKFGYTGGRHVLFDIADIEKALVEQSS